MRKPRHTFVTRSWPERYFTGLKTPAWRRRREIELLARRRKAHPTLGMSDRVTPKRPKSKWTLMFHRVYPGLKFDPGAIAKTTRIPVAKLRTVYRRGLKAWQTGGSRPGATAQAWGIARVYKFVLITKRKATAGTHSDPDNDLRR